MTKIYFTDYWWGNKRTKSEETFSSIGSFLDWFTDENRFKENYMAYDKDGITHFCDKKGEREYKCGDTRFELRVRTFDLKCQHFFRQFF